MISKFSAFALLMISVFPLSANADTCNPNSDVPLTAFSVTQDMRYAKEDYRAGSETCTFSVDQESRMNFKAFADSLGSFSDQDAQCNFTCVTHVKEGLKYIPVTSKLLFAVFAGSSVKLYNCKYASSTVQPSLDSAATEKKNRADGDSLNLQTNEHRLISRALKESNGDTNLAAKRLGITEKALLRKMKE